MKVKFVIYETKQWSALERTYDGVEVVPRMGEYVGVNTSWYDDSHGLVTRVVHWPTTKENNAPRIDEVAEVFVRMPLEDVNHYRENDTNWKTYDTAYENFYNLKEIDMGAIGANEAQKEELT